MFTNVLYAVWLLIPAGFFAIALWAKLEQLSKSPRRQNPGDFARQAVFLLGCVIVSILLDRYLLSSLKGSEITEWLPMGVMQFLLFPLILLIAARLIGGSRQISITNPQVKTKRKIR